MSNRSTSVLRLVAIALTATLSATVVSATRGEDPAPKLEGKLRAIIVCSAGGFKEQGLQGVLADRALVSNALTELVPADKLEITVVDPYKVAPKTVLDAIKGMTVQPEDAVLFYYSGHAANGGDGKYKGQIFQLRDANNRPYEDPLTRGDVRTALLDKKCRLVVMLTDCCNPFQVQPTQGSVGAESKGVAKSARATSTRRTQRVAQLFLSQDSNGLVDITSVQPGQYAAALAHGSIATIGWLNVFRAIDKNDSSARATWRDFYKQSRIEIERLYQEEIKKNPSLQSGLGDQEHMTCYAYALPGPLRLGLEVVTPQEGGVKVIRIAPDSPAARAGFRYGDIIDQISWPNNYAMEARDETLSDRERTIAEHLSTLTSQSLSNETAFNELIDRAPQFVDVSFVTKRRKRCDRDKVEPGQTSFEIDPSQLSEEEKYDLVDVDGRKMPRTVWVEDVIMLRVKLEGAAIED